MNEKDHTQQETSAPELIRIDASWDNDRFLAEAETRMPDGASRYAVLTDLDGKRLYRVMTESEYDAVFCRTDGFRPGPEHEIARYESLKGAADAGCPWIMAFGRLDDLADVKEKILEYTWLPDED